MRRRAVVHPPARPGGVESAENRLAGRPPEPHQCGDAGHGADRRRPCRVRAARGGCSRPRGSPWSARSPTRRRGGGRAPALARRGAARRRSAGRVGARRRRRAVRRGARRADGIRTGRDDVGGRCPPRDERRRPRRRPRALARVLHAGARLRRGDGPPRRGRGVEPGGRAHVRLRRRGGAGPRDGRADRPAAPSRRAPRRPRAAPGGRARRRSWSAGSRSPRCAATGRSSRAS